MYEITTEEQGKVVGITARDKLTGADLDALSAQLETLIERHGAIRMLFEMEDFHGWEADALVKDLRFDLRHNQDVERVAVVGDKTWEKWMAALMRLFAHAEVRYFERARRDEAWTWIREP